MMSATAISRSIIFLCGVAHQKGIPLYVKFTPDSIVECTASEADFAVDQPLNFEAAGYAAVSAFPLHWQRSLVPLNSISKAVYGFLSPLEKSLVFLAQQDPLSIEVSTYWPSFAGYLQDVSEGHAIDLPVALVDGEAKQVLDVSLFAAYTAFFYKFPRLAAKNFPGQKVPVVVPQVPTNTPQAQEDMPDKCD